MDKLREFCQKNKIFLFILALGILIVIFSGRSESTKENSCQTENEIRLENILNSMCGVGRVSVLLSGEGTRYDGYTGAVIVCEGADRAEARLRVINAVSAFTGLGTDKIIVEKMIIGGNAK